MSGLGFNDTLYAQQEALRLKAAQQEALRLKAAQPQLTEEDILYRDKYLKKKAAAAAKQKEDEFIAKMRTISGNDFFFQHDLKEALKQKYGNTGLPRFIKLKPFVNMDVYLYTSVIDTNTWEIYYPNPSNPNQYIKTPNPGFYNVVDYVMNLYYNLEQKMEAAPELELVGGRRRYKRAQNKSKSSKKRINKNKRRTRSRK
jgi:hypothetical protein